MFSVSSSPFEASESPLGPLKYYTLSFGLLYIIPLLSDVTFAEFVSDAESCLWKLHDCVSTGSRPGSKFLIQDLLACCWQLVGSFLKGIVRSIGPSSQTLVDWAVLLPLSRQAGENISELSSFHDLVFTL